MGLTGGYVGNAARGPRVYFRCWLGSSVSQKIRPSDNAADGFPPLPSSELSPPSSCGAEEENGGARCKILVWYSERFFNAAPLTIMDLTYPTSSTMQWWRRDGRISPKPKTDTATVTNLGKFHDPSDRNWWQFLLIVPRNKLSYNLRLKLVNTFHLIDPKVIPEQLDHLIEKLFTFDS